MGGTVYHFISVHSVLNGILWFNLFILLSLPMRRFKFPVKFSLTPLLLLLILGTARMFAVIERPNSILITSATLYPAIINFSRIEIMSHLVFGFPVNIFNLFFCLWITVTVVLIIRHLKQINDTRPEIQRMNRWPRDEKAEGLLREVIGPKKKVRVFRTDVVKIPMATAFKPYIVLPNVTLPDEQLRLILMHEWKHIQDKDILVRHVVDIICYMFWWNPFVYLLRWNFSFVRELKCDMYAVANKEDFENYLHGILKLYAHREEKKRSFTVDGADMLLTGNKEFKERLKLLAIRDESPKRRMLANIVSSIVIVAMLTMSYVFLIQPAFHGGPDSLMPADSFTDDYLFGDGGIYMAGDFYIVENEDGTFSLYIDGQFAGYNTECIDNEFFRLFPVRQREEN